MDNKIILSKEFLRMQKLAGLITEEETPIDPVADKDAEQGLKQALNIIKSGTKSLKPSEQKIDEIIGVTLGLIASAPGIMNILGNGVNAISSMFQKDNKKGTIVGNALKHWGHELEKYYIGAIGELVKKAFPIFKDQDIHDKTSRLYDLSHAIYIAILVAAGISGGIEAIKSFEILHKALEGGTVALKATEVVDLAKKIAAY